MALIEILDYKSSEKGSDGPFYDLKAFKTDF